MKYTESTPFSSEMDYEFFKETWCKNCAHSMVIDDGFPEFPQNGGCPVLDKLEYARLNSSEWHSKDIIEERDENGNIKYWHKCTKYMRKKEHKYNDDND